jgi:AcrR family transcriptional regulator
MGWLKNFFKRIVVEAITEVLEPRIRVVVQEEFVRLEPRIRAIVREEFENLEPRIRAIVRDEMRVAFEQEWEPGMGASHSGNRAEEFVRLERIRAIVREELRTAMEEEWVPRLQATWREDINRMQDRFNTRFDSVQGRLDNLAEMMLHATVQVREMGELAELVRSLRSEVERIKAHIGLT